MDKYKVVFEKKVLRDIKGRPKDVLERLKEITYTLENNPKPRGCIKLTGRDGFRIRVGNYRLLYLVDNKKRIVTITRIKHRREVYRK